MVCMYKSYIIKLSLSQYYVHLAPAENVHSMIRFLCTNQVQAFCMEALCDRIKIM